MPLVNTRSLMPIGTPASGPTGAPAMMSASMRFAVSRAKLRRRCAEGMQRRLELVHAREHGVDHLDRRELLGADGRARVTASMRQISLPLAAVAPSPATHLRSEPACEQ